MTLDGSLFLVNLGSTDLVGLAVIPGSSLGHWPGGTSSASKRGTYRLAPASWGNPLVPASLSQGSLACVGSPEVRVGENES